MNRNVPNKDSVFKGVGAILLGLIVLALVYNVFFTPQMPFGMGMNYGSTGGMHGGMGMNMGQGTMGTGFGFGLGSILAGILIILIKLLSILLVVGLVLGIWVVVKDYLFVGGENPFAGLTQSFVKPKMNCPKCGSSVDTKWDYCPDCGQQLTRENKPGGNVQQNQG